MTRNKYLRIAAAAFVALILGGCATSPQAPPPKFQWGQPVEFEGMKFDFNSARTASSFRNWINQTTYASDVFVIIEVALVNKTGAALPTHFQPAFQLVDDSGTRYVPDAMNTSMINMGKPGRAQFPQNLNPNTKLTQEIVFSVPRQKYAVQVIVPSRASVGFGGAITASGPYFLFDIASQL